MPYPTGPSHAQPVRDMLEVKENISEALAAIDGPTSFAHGAALKEPTNPGLFLHDYGTIGLPLSKNDAQTIISKAQQSPFGKGSETIVDTTVRKSWQLDRSQFTLRNPKWNPMIGKVLSEVCEALYIQCAANQVHADLYKLLLYEEGAFFKPHQDSEKAPGMFGTLVVCLPSTHQGGELILKHGNDTIVFDTSSTSEYDMSYASWYSDVFHQVKPVTSGYRLVLTYNLIRRDGVPTKIPPGLDSHRDSLVGALTEYSNGVRDQTPGRDQFPQWLIHMFEYQYTQASLRSELLKGADLGRVQCLQQVAADLGFKLFLAILEKQVDKDDEGDGDEIDSSLSIKHVVQLDGSALGSGSQNVTMDNLLDEDYERHDHDESEHEGYTGNAGATATYWYRDAVSAQGLPFHRCWLTTRFRRVLLIVPPTMCVRFEYDYDSTNSKLLAWIRKLRLDAEPTNASGEELMKLCGLINSEKLSNPYGLSQPFRTRPQEHGRSVDEQVILVQEMILGTLQCEDHTLYDSVVAARPTMTDEIFRELGKHLCLSEDRMPFEKRIVKALEVIESPHGKYEALRMVACGFQQSGVSEEEENLPEFKAWLKEVNMRSVREAIDPRKMGKVEGAGLAYVIETWTAKEVETHIVPSILACSTACKVGFANRVMECVVVADIDAAREDSEASATRTLDNIVADADSADQAVEVVSTREIKDESTNNNAASPSTCAVPEQEPATHETHMLSQSDRVELTIPVFGSIWQSFSLDTTRASAFTADDPRRGEDAQRLQKVAEGILNGRDLCNLLTHTIAKQVLPTAEIEKKLLFAVNTAGPLASTTTLIPFISLVLGQRFERYRLKSVNNQPSPEGVKMVAAMLRRFVDTCVGREPPQQPANWTQPTGRCSCGDCSSVNDFLRSPNRQVGNFPVNKKRRAHLHNTFNNLSRASYTIETLRHSTPNIWQITKNNSGHDHTA